MAGRMKEVKDADLGLFGRVLVVYMRQQGTNRIEITEDDIKELINLPYDEQPMLTYVERSYGLSIRLMTRHDSVKFAKEVETAYHKSKNKSQK